jgi:hypothetical protein
LHGFDKNLDLILKFSNSFISSIFCSVWRQRLLLSCYCCTEKILGNVLIDLASRDNKDKKDHKNRPTDQVTKWKNKKNSKNGGKILGLPLLTENR